MNRDRAYPPSLFQRAKSTPFEIVPIFAAVVFSVASFGAAWIETPTVDEIAHVPAGLVHWRTGNLGMYGNNPPLGKMWVALPLAIDNSVALPEVHEVGGIWQPWVFGMQFEEANRARYLSLMFRSRLMTLPLVLLTACVIYRWTSSLFGRFAASMTSSLFLLSPTVLAHGHLATVDIASMATILFAIAAARQTALRPSRGSILLAGAALGVALAVKFSALFLLAAIPVVTICLAGNPWRVRARRAQIAGIGLYLFTAWFVLNLLMAFQGTFAPSGNIRVQSKGMQDLLDHLPTWCPLFLPRPYMEGLSALQADIETGYFRGYLHGEWSARGWASYYPIAFAIKESEPIVLLTIVSLVVLAFIRPGWRESVALLFPPALFLFIAAFANSLCLGIRYVLPIFPFLFILMGATFALIERVSSERIRRYRSLCWALSGSVAVYQVVLTFLVFPSYLGYFNSFVGGSTNGDQWLIDSNLDWGQDLYRLPMLGKQRNVDRWKLLYFGHVDPGLYGIAFDVPTAQLSPGFYAVSVNYQKGMSYAIIDRQGNAMYPLKQLFWIKALLPTEQIGSLYLYDLRDPATPTVPSSIREHNLGVMRFSQKDVQRAAAHFQAAVRLDPMSPTSHFYLSSALVTVGDFAGAIAALKQALILAPNWDEAMNNLAWMLVSAPNTTLQNAADAVALAQRACEQTHFENLNYVDTLITALLANHQSVEATRRCQLALEAARLRRDAEKIKYFEDRLRDIQAVDAPR